eukprot:TRINITY_DN21875_c0_g1_i1.p1 TRINITY_DN21875_c0_g1~~TRINITY_DN21875_c0_g1_i1.p1  ORF type:complete len:520 (-),score=74.53 TRINITY_DN21875_c0_g1_i1:78-1571(-)
MASHAWLTYQADEYGFVALRTNGKESKPTHDIPDGTPFGIVRDEGEWLLVRFGELEGYIKQRNTRPSWAGIAQQADGDSRGVSFYEGRQPDQPTRNIPNGQHLVCFDGFDDYPEFVRVIYKRLKGYVKRRNVVTVEANARAEAVDALRHAMAGDEIEPLSTAIDKIDQMDAGTGEDDDLVSDARTLLKSLVARQERAAAALALTMAIESRNTEALQEAVEQVMWSFGCGGENTQLRDALAILNENEVAAKALASPFAKRLAVSANNGSAIKLDRMSPKFAEIRAQFEVGWNTQKWGYKTSPPQIEHIFSINVPTALWMDYEGGKEQIGSVSVSEKHPQCNGENPGNEMRRFHGTRLVCDFQGEPCNDPGCSVCRIIQGGRFSLSCIGEGSKNMGHFGSGLYFTSFSNTAKGYGLDPAAGLTPPPKSMKDFVSLRAGNAVIVALVIAGRPQIVEVPTTDPLPPGFNSRLAIKKTTKVDELVIFNENQVIPRYLITFPR